MLFRCQGESESERLVDPGVGATIDADLQIRGGVLTHRRGGEDAALPRDLVLLQQRLHRRQRLAQPLLQHLRAGA